MNRLGKMFIGVLSTVVWMIPIHVRADTTPTASTTASAIPLPEISSHAESDQASLHDIELRSATDPLIKMVDVQLPTLTHEIDSRHLESSKILNSAPTVDILRGMEKDWQKLAETLDDWNRDLTRRAVDLDSQSKRLAVLQDTWQQTGDLAKAPETPPVVLQHIHEMVASIGRTRLDVDRQRAVILKLQNEVADVDGRVDQALGSVKQAREQALSRLLLRDSEPIWHPDLRSQSIRAIGTDTCSSLATQFHELEAYARRQSEKFFSLALLVLALVAAVYWIRREVRPWLGAVPALQRSAHVLEAPIATAFLTAVFIGQRTYPHAPRLWWGVVGVAAVVPTIIILRRVLDVWLFPVLNALVVFYFLYRVRMMVAAVPVLSRFIFIGEGLAAVLFVVTLIRKSALENLPQETRIRRGNQVRWLEWSVMILSGTALLANILGFVGLASLLANGVIRSGYLALTLYALLCFADVLLAFLLREGPIARLGMIRKQHDLIWGRLRWILQRVTFLFWLWSALDFFAVREPLFQLLGMVLTAGLTLGSVTLSLDKILEFFGVLWAAYWVSRLVRFILEEDIYPHVSLGRGIPYAISTMIHYAILTGGIIFAMGALGIDMTKFTILAGAFGVGLGFGLQTIMNNFFSGLILLFERPIKVGDVIETGGVTGRVQYIGIRASTLRTNSGSEVIVPNGNLISAQITNWTFSAEQRAIELQVSSVSTADPHHVMTLIEDVLKADPRVEKNPPPRALFLKVGAGSMDFEIHAWTGPRADWMQVRSDLTININAALSKESLAIH